MAQVKYKNKATGKSYTGEAKDVEILRSNKVLAAAYSFEKEEPKPEDLKTTTKTKTPTED